MSKRVEESVIHPFGDFSFGIRIKYNYDGEQTNSSGFSSTPAMPISATSTAILPEIEEYHPQPTTSERARTTFNRKQLRALERTFENNKYLTSEQVKELAERVEITEKQVRDWFRNNRSRRSLTRENCGKEGRNAERKIEQFYDSLSETSSSDNDYDYLSSEEEGSDDEIKILSLVKEMKEDKEVPVCVYSEKIQLAIESSTSVHCKCLNCISENFTDSEVVEFMDGFTGSPLELNEAEREILAAKPENEEIQLFSDIDEIPVPSAIQFSSEDITSPHVDDPDTQQMLLLPAAARKPKVEIIEQIIFYPKNLHRQKDTYLYSENVEQSIKNRTKFIHLTH